MVGKLHVFLGMKLKRHVYEHVVSAVVGGKE